MSRYEDRLKLDQLGNFLEEKKYDKALEIVQEFDIDKIKETPELKLFAEVYSANEMYVKARDIYRTIYEQINTRRILYKLIMLCIKCDSLPEAESLYQEYLTKDKGSIERLTLKYRIDKAKGADTEVLIKDLEEIKDEEYIEEWAYELAKQYHKAGMIEECINECHNIIIWFSEGEIANKAKLLKMHYDGNVSDEVIEDFQESISEDIRAFIQEELPKEKVMPEEDEYIPEEEKKEEKAVTDNTIDVRSDLTDNIISNLMSGINPETINEIQKEDVVKASPETEASEEVKEETAEEEKKEDVTKAQEPDETAETIKGLSKYGKSIPYTRVKTLFKGISTDPKPPINIAIAASEPTYYLTIVKKITKELQNRHYMGEDKIKIAKIGADTLNTLRLDEQIDELLGSCIMIEGASQMNAQTINSIIRVLDVYSTQLIIILIDDEEQLSKMLFKEEILKNQIKYFVAV